MLTCMMAGWVAMTHHVGFGNLNETSTQTAAVREGLND